MKLKDLASGFPVLAVTGPRQSGKTTLVKVSFPDYKYISLEDHDIREEAVEDPRGFLNRLGGRFIIDEVQHVPELFSYIQTYVDGRNEMGDIVLTGSQNFLLLEKITESLAGRVGMIELMPFSMSELKDTGSIKKSLDEQLFHGSYPPIYDRNLKPSDWYSRYIQTYIDRDVRSIRNIGNLSLFQRFVRLCAGRIGQLINFSNLANDCGVDVKTAQAWMSVLEASYIVFLLKPHHRNYNKRLVKQPKLYFYDTGLASCFLGLSSADQLGSHYLRGELFENFVITEFLKARMNLGEMLNLYFWRDSVGNEVDLLIEEGSLSPVEIKSGATLNSSYYKGLKYYKKLSGDDCGKLRLFYGGDRSAGRGEIEVCNWRSLSEL